MRRSILLSLLVIGAVATVLGFGSWAVFRDSETSTGNVVGAGTLDLAIGGASALPIALDDLKPSVVQYAGPIVLKNVGGNPGGLDLHFLNVVDDGGALSEPEQAAEYAGPIDDISNWIEVDWCLDTNVNGVRNCSGVIRGTLGDIESRTFDLGYTLNPATKVELWISFHLLRSAGNEYQGDTSTFDLEFTLHQVTEPASAITVRLENKTTNWDAILGDDLYGSVTYEVRPNGNLKTLVKLNGLTPNKWHQLVLSGPHGGVCDATDDQLASGSEQFTGFDSGFWNGVGPAINQGLCGVGGNNEGMYSYAYVKTDANGDYNGTIVITNSGESDPADAGKVLAANPALPTGIYSDVKFLVKEIVASWDGPPIPLPWIAPYFTTELMEMDTLDFNLP